jgi:cyclic pyranopterin phosphate synthase
MSGAAETPVHVSADRTLRVKVIDACGMACTFCHNEGTPVVGDNLDRGAASFTAAGKSGRVSIYLGSNGARFLPGTVTPDLDFVRALRSLRYALSLNELHLTGGEPTLHPQLASVVTAARGAGYRVCMTSNGENGARAIPPAAEAGLDRINFSVFGTTAAELAQVQHAKYADERRAERKIAALTESIATAVRHGVKASANIVVPDYTHHDRVLRLLEQHGPELSVRLLNSLDEGEESTAAIRRILDELRAEPIATYLTAGTSGYRTAYRLPSGRVVMFKQIRPVRLPSTCSDCRFNNDQDCQEGYYGVRLYKDRLGGYLVGVCIQRMDLCMPVEEFVNSDLCAEVLRLRVEEYRRLIAA